MQTTLFSRQGGVASVAALRRQGITEGQIRWALRQGQVASVRGGWLNTADADPGIVAAVAAGGRLGCVSAAARHGLWVPDHDELHVSLPTHAGRHSSANVVPHWAGARWRDHSSPIERLEDVLRQVAGCLPLEDLICILDSALQRKRVTLQRLHNLLSHLPDHADIAELLDGRSESGYETLCRLRFARLGVAISVQPLLPGIGRVDLLLGERLIIEADGWEWHNGPDAFLIDRSRDLAANRQGYLPLRLAPHHIEREWPWVELVVRSIIERGDHRWSPQHARQRRNHGFGG